MSQQESLEEGRFLTLGEVVRIKARKQPSIQIAQETLGTRTKHLRLSIDFHITITEDAKVDDRARR